MENPLPTTTTPFFIVGSPRSGTTLLERLLNRHSRLFIPPETDFFYAMRKKGLLGKPYTRAQGEDFLKFYFSTRTAKLLKLQESGLTPESLVTLSTSWGEVFLNLLEALKQETGKARVGEKTPYHLRCASQIHEMFPEARFIALIRDGRAVVRSRLEHPHWEQNLWAASRTWVKDARLLMEFTRNSKDVERLLIIRYESLVLNTETTIRDVPNFIGERFEPEIFNQSLEIPDRYQDYYSQEWMNANTAAVDRSKVDKWVNEFTATELSLVQRVMKSELCSFGYQPRQINAAGWPFLLGKELLRHGTFKLRAAVVRRAFS